MPRSKSQSAALESTKGTTRRSVYLLLAVALLAMIGLADSIYLSVEHFAGRTVRCTITSGCNEVLTSAYSTLGGIPLAPLGALAYFLAFSLATLAAFGNRLARTLLFYLAGLMLLFSAWLFVVQAFILHAFCQFCLLSGAVTLLLATLVAIDRFFPKRT